MEQTPNPEADLLLNLQAAGLSKEEAAAEVASCKRTWNLSPALTIHTLSAYAMKLSRELAAAREDSQMLEWYMSHSEWKLCRESQGWWSCRNVIRQQFTPAFPTFREAIDAAMQEQADGE